MTQPNADKLKGCPCCSGAAVPEVRWEPDSDILTYSAHIKCTKCFLRTAGGTVNSKAAVDELLQHEIRDWNTRPALSVGGDVVEDTRPDCSVVDVTLSDEHFPNYAPLPGNLLEAMAKAAFRIPGEAYMLSTEGDTIRRAISAAAAMGYVLTPSERVLPELPGGYFISQLGDAGDQWFCFISPRTGPDIVSQGFGPTPRAAVLSAISKIGQK